MREHEQLEMEVHIDHAKKAVAFGEAIDRLIRNKDFITVIDDGYTTAEARRLTLLLGDPAIENKDATTMSLRAIGEFHQYLRARLGYADEMRKALADYEEYQETHGDDADGDA